MSDDPIWRFVTLIVSLCALSKSTLILLVPLHNIEADVGSFWQRIDIFLILDRVYLFIPFESLVLSSSEFVAIRFFLGCYVSVTETFGGALLLSLLDGDLRLRLHIVFVKIITRTMITFLKILKITMWDLIGECCICSRHIWTFCHYIFTAWPFFWRPPALSHTSFCSKYCQIRQAPWATVCSDRNPCCSRLFNYCVWKFFFSIVEL